MDEYIKGNKEAWEEAFDNRSPEYGADIEKLLGENFCPYAYFDYGVADVLKKYDMRGKKIGQFCCNNGRELLSLVKTTGAESGIGFDIAENMVAFANEKAEKLSIPCRFIAKNMPFPAMPASSISVSMCLRLQKRAWHCPVRHRAGPGVTAWKAAACGFSIPMGCGSNLSK